MHGVHNYAVGDVWAGMPGVHVLVGGKAGMPGVIYPDFLPPPKKVSHVNSDKTHTGINIHPLALILDICQLISSSCGLFM